MEAFLSKLEEVVERFYLLLFILSFEMPDAFLAGLGSLKQKVPFLKWDM